MSSQSHFDEQSWRFPQGWGRAGCGPLMSGSRSLAFFLPFPLLFLCLCFTLTSLSFLSSTGILSICSWTLKAVSNVFNDVVELDSGNGNITLPQRHLHTQRHRLPVSLEHYNVRQVPSELAPPETQEPSSWGPAGKEGGEGELISRSRERGLVSITEAPGKVRLPCHPGFIPTASRHPERTSGFVRDCASERLQLSGVSVLARGLLQ